MLKFSIPPPEVPIKCGPRAIMLVVASLGLGYLFDHSATPPPPPPLRVHIQNCFEIFVSAQSVALLGGKCAFLWGVLEI